MTDDPHTHTLEPGALDALAEFRRLIAAESQSLVSLSDRERLTEHVADSLVALDLIDSLKARSLIDLGSGGGFPALPLAITRPTLMVTLMESIGWKARFLATTTASLNLQSRVSVRAMRAEEVASVDGREGFDLGTARAVAPPIVVAELLAPLVRVGGHLLLWTTGSVVDAHMPEAVGELGLGAPVAHGAPSTLRDDAVLLVWPKVAPCESRFPRRVGVATKRPLRPLPRS